MLQVDNETPGVLHVYAWICRTCHAFSGFSKRIFRVPTAVL